MPPTQSVFIPVNTVMQQMLASLQASDSLITDFSEGSIARTLSESVGIVISGQSTVADQLQNDSYIDSATGDALDALGTGNWMVPRMPAVQATGMLTITRQSASGAVTIPAGWGQLSTIPSVPGDPGVAVLTTQDADFADGETAVTVSWQAVLGGVAGNLTAGTFLTPLAPVNGISSQNGFQVTAAGTGGVDAETDTAYAARIPIAVQGRAPGKVVSFLAGALGVPGVLSANVLTPGQKRSDGSIVLANNIEVYYQGAPDLLAAVQAAAQAAETGTQNATAYAAIDLTAPRGQQRVVADVTVWCQPGTDPVALAPAVAASLQAYVNGVGLAGTAYQALATEAVIGTYGVVSMDIPLTEFCLYGGSGAVDIPMGGDQYPNLAASDVTVTVNTLTD